MASLKKILGSNIQVLDDDPVQNVGSWASISSGNTARTSTFSIGQSYTAMAAVGGLNPGSTPKAETETWNGTAWTEVNDMPAGKGDHASAGTLTAAFAATGFQPWPNSPTVNFDWDGTNWTAGGSVNTGRYGAMGAGTLTAGMIAGGIIPPGANYSNTVELYNGTSWTETTEINTARSFIAGAGATNTAVVVAGGEAPLRANTELWNGSSWTEVNDLNTAAQAGRMCGTSTASLYAGGSRPGNSTLTEQWDGTNWTEVGDLGTTRNKQAQGGSTTAAVVGFGAIPAITATAEEWEFPPVTSTIQQEGQLYFKGGALKGFEKAGGIPAATWSSGGTMNTARQYGGAFGSQTAGLVAGGETSTAVNNVEQYDGTSWTEITEINTTRYGLEGFGDSYTSGFVVGGAPNKTETESWNGTAWTEVNDLPQGTERGGCAGTSTSAFYVGGYKYPSPAQPTNVGYDWDGSSWGTGNNLNQPRDRMGAAGVITSGIVFGGTSGPPYTERNETELYDGSSWTETGNLNTTRRELGASAFNRTNGLVLGFGGEPPATANTEIFNGSSWTEVNNLSTARAAGGGLGTSIAAAFAGGSGVTGATEHFTADITNTTITSS